MKREQLKHVPVLSVHGIEDDGEQTVHKTGRLLSERFGWQHVPVTYPHVSALGAWWGLRQWEKQRPPKLAFECAEHLMNHYVEGAAVRAHSFGALVTLAAMWMGAKFSVVVLYGAAVDTDRTWPHDGAQRIVIVKNARDTALLAGGALRFHAFGCLGRKGYDGPADSRILEVDAKPLQRDRLNHSTYFLDHNIQGWVTREHGWYYTAGLNP